MLACARFGYIHGCISNFVHMCIRILECILYRFQTVYVKHISICLRILTVMVQTDALFSSSEVILKSE